MSYTQVNTHRHFPMYEFLLVILSGPFRIYNGPHRP